VLHSIASRCECQTPVLSGRACLIQYEPGVERSPCSSTAPCARIQALSDPVWRKRDAPRKSPEAAASDTGRIGLDEFRIASPGRRESIGQRMGRQNHHTNPSGGRAGARPHVSRPNPGIDNPIRQPETTLQGYHPWPVSPWERKSEGGFRQTGKPPAATSQNRLLR
jgi:hypothetical protein